MKAGRPGRLDGKMKGQGGRQQDRQAVRKTGSRERVAGTNVEAVSTVVVLGIRRIYSPRQNFPI
jgi:hypothetical protein